MRLAGGEPGVVGVLIVFMALLAAVSCRGDTAPAPTPNPTTTPTVQTTQPQITTLPPSPTPTATKAVTPTPTPTSPVTREPTSIPAVRPTPTETAASVIGPTPEPSPTPVPGSPPATATPAPTPTAAPQPTRRPTPRLSVRNRVTLVTHGGPPNLNIMDRFTSQAQLATDSLGDPLKLMDFGTGRLVPRLSEGWEMLGTSRWRFLLRQDVEFHNGEAFDAEAAAWAINWQADPANASYSGRHIRRARATATGRFTLEVSCQTTCPILPRQIIYAQFQAPKWAQEQPQDFKRLSVRLGPYRLERWEEGKNIELASFENCWDRDGAPIRQARIVWNPERKTRAAMVASDVAQWAYDIRADDRALFPRWVSTETLETVAIKLDARSDPLTSAVLVGQALALAVDCEALVQAAMDGLGTCRGVPFHHASTGAGDNFAPFDFNPQEARRLITRANASGKLLTLHVREGTVKEARLWEEVARY